MEKFSSRIKKAMNLRNVKQSELVEKTGINKGALSSYLSGRYEPKQTNIYLLAKALHVNEAWLMGYDVAMEKRDEVILGSELAKILKEISTNLNIDFSIVRNIFLYSKALPGKTDLNYDNIYSAIVDKVSKMEESDQITQSDQYEEHLKDKPTDEQIYQQLDMSFIKVPLYDSISCGAGGFVDDNIIDYVSVPDSNLNPHKEYFAQKAKGDSMVNAGILEDTICVFEKANTIDDGKIGCFCIDDGIATCKKFKKGPSFIQLLPMNNNYDPIVIDLHDMNFRVLGVLKTSIKNWE